MATTDGKKTGGRQPGSGNVVTKLLRENVQDIVEGNLDQLIVDMAFMKPKERADVMLQLMKFVMPQLKAVDFQDNTPKDPEKKFAFVFVNKEDYVEND